MVYQMFTLSAPNSATLYLPASHLSELLYMLYVFLCALCVSVVKSLRSSASFASLRFNMYSPPHVIAMTAAAHMPNLQRGGITRAIRRNAPFQRRAPSLPPPQNVNSADAREAPARQFGGNYAKFEKTVNHLQHE